MALWGIVGDATSGWEKDWVKVEAEDEEKRAEACPFCKEEAAAAAAAAMAAAEDVLDKAAKCGEFLRGCREAAAVAVAEAVTGAAVAVVVGLRAD